jgi:hypothetical protein
VRLKTSNVLLDEQGYFGTVRKGQCHLVSHNTPSIYDSKNYQSAFEKVVASVRLS